MNRNTECEPARDPQVIGELGRLRDATARLRDSWGVMEAGLSSVLSPACDEPCKAGVDIEIVPLAHEIRTGADEIFAVMESIDSAKQRMEL